MQKISGTIQHVSSVVSAGESRHFLILLAKHPSTLSRVQEVYATVFLSPESPSNIPARMMIKPSSIGLKMAILKEGMYVTVTTESDAEIKVAAQPDWSVRTIIVDVEETAPRGGLR